MMKSDTLREAILPATPALRRHSVWDLGVSRHLFVCGVDGLSQPSKPWSGKGVAQDGGTLGH
jgi:hypothetical protein